MLVCLFCVVVLWFDVVSSFIGSLNTAKLMQWEHPQVQCSNYTVDFRGAHLFSSFFFFFLWGGGVVRGCSCACAWTCNDLLLAFSSWWEVC